MHCFLIAVFLVIGQLLTYNGATANGVVEIYVAIDQRVIEDYINRGSTVAGAEDDARRDAEYFLDEVNNIMQATGMDIEIRVRQMDVLAQDVFSDCRLRDGDSIHEDLGLQTFERHLKDQGLFNSLNYDMALLWTGYNIYGKSDATAGYASVGSICEENAVTIVEYDGTYRVVHVTAHEIGHILGLNHDQQACDNGYIMTDTLSFSTQRWSFSPCSLQTLSELIPGMACLTDTNAGSQIPDQAVVDDLLNPNIMCKRARNNTDSYMCKSWNFYGGNEPQGDIVCQRIYCSIPGTNTCAGAHTTNGMICGVDHRCSNEECATAPADFPTPAGLEANCLFGDDATLSLSSGLTTTCSEFLAPSNQRHQCYSASIERACCATCQSLRGDIPGCAYGDRSSQCVDYSQDAVCPAYKDSLCCEYCSNWSRKRSAHDDQNPPSLKATKIDKVTREKMEKENETEEDSNTAE